MKFFPISLTAKFCVTGALSLVLAGTVPLRAQTPTASSLQPDNAELHGNPVFPKVFLRDVVVSNTDPNLKNTDKFYNSEPGIAIDPTDPRRIVISAFSGSWTPLDNGPQFRAAPLWYSRNGGQVWTKEHAISPPPGVRKGVLVESPCDITFDYGRDGTLYGTFLLDGSGEEGGGCSGPIEEAARPEAAERGEIISGATADPAHAGAWQWLAPGGITQPTNHHNGADQPWITVNKDPSRPRRDRVYVAYQSSAMQVAAAKARPPLDFTLDSSPGPSTQFGGNPGLRIAADHRSGAIYSVHETGAPIQCSSGSPVSYVLNRSVDGGATWSLNSSPDGISVAQVCSNQNIYTYGFGEPFPGAILGGVNRLRGGIDTLAVDPKTGDVYVVYGVFDEPADRDRLAIVRLVDRGDGWMEPRHPHFVSGTEYQSALPAVAVNDQGTVAVLYDTADGLDEDTSRPYFSVHLAASQDHGQSFRQVLLQKFLLPENSPGSGNAGPRPLGDYQQLKSFHDAFYGVFAGDGQPFGRPFHKIDPIFVKTSAP